MRHVVMVGTALEGRGGMSSVVASYRAQGLFDRAKVFYIETHREVSALGKLGLVFGGLLRLLRLLLTGRVALIHIHAASGVSFWRKSLFAVLGRLFHRPVIVHIHGGEFLEFYRGCSPFGRWFVRWVLEGAARVVVLSNTWAQRVGEISPRLRVAVVANPVALPAGEILPRDCAALNFLFLGRLERDKGVFELVDAFAALVKDFPEARLILAGEGERDAVLEKIAALGIGPQVELPGWVTGETKANLLAAASVFVLPSYIEGLPVSMLEAMAYGVPVIVSRVGSVPEVLLDGENGLMVEAGSVDSLREALFSISASPVLRKKLGDAGRALVERDFAANIVGSRVEQIYRDVLSQEAA